VKFLLTEGLIPEEDDALMVPPYRFFNKKPSHWDEFIENLDSNNSKIGDSIKLQEESKSKLIECCRNDGLKNFWLTILTFSLQNKYKLYNSVV
jgi:hypothetical protein